MYLDELERQFILGYMDVVNEFETASFIANASSAIKGKFQAVNMRSKLRHFSDSIGEAVQSINNITIDSRAISEFLNQYQTFTRLNDGTYTVRDINSDEFGPIKVQYISQYVDIITKLLEKTVNNTVTQDEVDTYAGEDIVNKVKRQAISKALSYDTKHLATTPRTTYSTFDEKYVRGQLLPFVNSFSKQKNALIAEATGVQHAIKEAEDSFDATLMAVQKFKEDNRISQEVRQKLDYVTFNVLNGLLEVLGFVTYVVIAKLNNFGSSVLAAEKCYYDVQNAYADGFVEGVMDNIFPTDDNNLGEDIEAGRAGAFGSVANNLYEYHSNNPLMGMTNGDLKSTGDILHSAFGMELDFTGYNKTIYDDIIKMYLEIGVGLNIVARSCDDYLMIFTDIRKEAGFIISLEDRFRSILNRIDDVSYYSSDIPGITDNNVFRNALAEVKDYEDNMNRIASTACDIKVKIDYVEKLLDQNVNGEFKDAESLNEYRIMLARLREEFSTLNNIVGTQFMKRLRALGAILTNVTTKVEDPNAPSDVIADIDLDHTDYRQESTKIDIQDLEKKQNAGFFALEAYYAQEKTSVLRGQTLILEADTPQSNSSSTQAPAAENNAQNSANGTTGAKPTVVDNSGEGSSSSTGVSGIIEKIKRFISTFITNMNRSGEKNTKWVNENAQALSNRGYENVTLNILPYKNIPYTKIVPFISSVTRTVNAMTPQTLQGIKSKQDAYSKVFAPLTNSGISADGNISASVQIENYFKTGNASGAKVVAIANNELKTQVVSEMIPFCQTYTTQFTQSLQQALTDLGGAVEGLGKKIGQANPANTQNDNTAGNMQQSASYIASAATDLSTGVLNAVRHRNNDYLKSLSSLKPKEPVANVRATTNPEANQAQAQANVNNTTAQAQAQEPTVTG